MVSCSSLTDCYNCTTVTWGCHWCPDQTCSLYGSPHCLVGETCAAPPDCIRTEPEFNGYQAPPAKAVLLFLLIALIIMAAFICCLWGCFAVWDRRRMKALKNRIESRRRSQSASNSAATPSSRGVQLSSLPVSASFRGSLNSHSSSSSQPRVSVVTTKKKVTPGNELGENLLERKEQQDSSDDSELVGENAPRYNVRINPDGTTEVIQAAPASGVASPTIPFPPPLPPLPRKQQLLRTGAKFCTIMGCLGTFIALIVVCLMFPHMPQYSVCNKDIQWGSILTNMRNFQAAVNVDLLLSVWNPNRFHLVLNRIDCRILYGQDIVGTGSQYNVSFRAGRINDFILTVDFAPSVVSAAHMLADHLKGSLMLDVLFDIDTSILVSDFASPLYRVNTSYVYESIDAEGQAEIEEERKYCKCVDPDNKPSSPKSLAAVFSPTSPATAGAAAPSTKIGRRFTENPLRRPKVRARVQFAPVGGGRRDAVSLPALRIDTSQQP